MIKFKTSNNNSYLYSKGKKLFLNISELFNEVIELKNENHTDDNIIRLLKDKYDIQEINYYINYYSFLKENSFFTINDEKLEGRYTVSHLLHNISNINQIIFEVTDDCNLSCEYCGYGELYGNYDVRNKKKLDFELAKNLIDYIYDYINSKNNSSFNKPLSFSFYGGEPLLNIPLIKKIVTYIENKSFKSNFPRFNLTTNALLLKKNIDFLIEHDFSLLISLDGDYNNSSYRVFHNNKNAFPEIYNNIMFVKENYPDFFEKIRFNAVLHNKNSVQEIYEFFKKHFNKTPQISELHSSGVKESMQNIFWEKYKNVVKDVKSSTKYEEINNEMFIEMPEIKAISDLIFNYTDYVFNDYSDLFSDEKVEIIPTGTCEPFSRRIFLTVSGKLLPCEKVGQNFTIGQVTKDKVIIDFEKVTLFYNDKLDSIAERQCKKCLKNTNCNKCMLQMKIKNNEFVCDNYMNKDLFIKDLSRRLAFLEKNKNFYNRIIENINIK